MKRLVTGAALAALLLALPRTAGAEPHSGVDAQLYRSSFDSNGLFSLESGQLLPKRDFSIKFNLAYAQRPLAVAVPGIGGTTDEGSDAVLDFVLGLHIAAGFSISSRWELVLETGLYRTDPDEGYGVRGLYRETGSEPSTGLQSLRPLSNIDQSGTNVGGEIRRFEDTGLVGPFDVRIGLKYKLKHGKSLRAAFLAVASVPFGDEEMFLGDAGFVLEPRLAVDYLLNKSGTAKFVTNVGARLRRRTVLEAYNPDPTLTPAPTPNDARAVLDVGSELIAGAGVQFELLPQVLLGAEGVFFVPLPKSLSLNHQSCTLNNGRPCGALADDDDGNGAYFASAGYGDLAGYGIAGMTYRATADTSLMLSAGAGLAGARRDAFRVMTGITWQPTPRGTRVIGRGDRDSDGVADASDICPDEPEDKDGYQDGDGCPDLDNDGDGIIDANDTCPNEPEDKDGHQDEDGCPERDNDGDGVPDVTDRCPNQAEDKDGFEDDDGCPEDDNDGDGIKDKDDKCPNQPETPNGVDDEDGCPDVAQTSGPVLQSDRIDLRGAKIVFVARSARLTKASQAILDQVAEVMKKPPRPVIRIEVHVALSTRSKNRRAIARAHASDRRLAGQRAEAINAYLRGKGISARQLQFVGIGSKVPILQPAYQAANERVDFIRVR